MAESPLPEPSHEAPDPRIEFSSNAPGADRGGVAQESDSGPQVGSIVADVRGLMDDAKGGAISAANSGKDALAVGLQDISEAVHDAGEQLEGHQDWLAHLVERGADELGSLAGTLRTNDLRALMTKLEELARSQPALFAGAALAAGFAAARLGKAAVAGSSRADLPEMPEVLRDPK
jgi:hypothetical protein